MITNLFVDGTNLTHRAFYALSAHGEAPEIPLIAGVVLRAINQQCGYLADARGSVVVVFDSPGGSGARRALLSTYKVNRNPAPGVLRDTLNDVPCLLSRAGLRVMHSGAVEADDVIATLCAQSEQRLEHAIVLSSDRDLLQLVSGLTFARLITTSLRDAVLFTAAQFREKYAFSPPRLLADYKALVGDVSDNITGVRGIGPKTAAQLLAQFGRLANVYDALAIGDTFGGPLIAPRVARLLEAERERALLNLQLTTLRRDVAGVTL